MAANVLHIKLPRHCQNQKKNCESMHPGGGDDSVWMEKVTGGVRRDRSSMENTFEQSFYHVWSVCMCVRPSCHYRWGSFKLHIRSTMVPIIRQPINLLSCRGLLGNAQHKSQLGGGRGGKEVFGSTFFIFSAFHLFILWNTNITYFCTTLSQPRRSELSVLYLPSKSF